MGEIVDREVWQKLAAKARSSMEANDPPGPRFTAWVAVVAAVSGLVLLSGGVGLLVFESTDDGWMGAMIVLALGAVGFAVSGQHLINEGALPTLPARDPGTLVEVFLKALSIQRWDTAKACLARVARIRTERPELRPLGLKGKTFNIALDQYFKAYWAPLCAGDGLTEASLSYEVRRVETIEPGLSVVWVSLTLSHRTQMVVATETVDLKMFGRLVAYERDGAWHLLYGGLPLAADVRLPVSEEETEVPRRPERAARPEPSPPRSVPKPLSASGQFLGGGAGAAAGGQKVSGRLLGKPKPPEQGEEPST